MKQEQLRVQAKMGANTWLTQAPRGAQKTPFLCVKSFFFLSTPFYKIKKQTLNNMQM